MALPLMPKATAVWLVENTTLTFDQIADFCGLHALEVQAIADGEVAQGMHGLDPVANGQVTHEDIKSAEGDPARRLTLTLSAVPEVGNKQKGPRYTPVARRQDKPDAIAYLLKAHPELSDAQIVALIGTTKPTIAGVRERTHWNMLNIRGRHPVTLGLCTQFDLETAIEKARRQGKTIRPPVPMETEE
jgi:hypothetical protein